MERTLFFGDFPVNEHQYRVMMYLGQETNGRRFVSVDDIFNNVDVSDSYDMTRESLVEDISYLLSNGLIKKIGENFKISITGLEIWKTERNHYIF